MINLLRDLLERWHKRLRRSRTSQKEQESFRCLQCSAEVKVDSLSPQVGRGERHAVCVECGTLHVQRFGWDRLGFWQGLWKQKNDK